MNGINIVTANFSNGGRQCITRKLFQYDYGQKVQIKGLNLPQSFEFHISNTNNPLSSSNIFLGRKNEIEIPDEFLISGEDIYIWIFLHQTVNDGETRYTINIPIQKRPKIESKQPTPVEKNVVDQLISSLEEKIDEMSDATEEAKDTFLKYPKIIDDYWYVYDIETKSWINSEVKALGENDVGIKEVRFNDNYSLTIIFTDDSVFNTPSIRGEKGEQGVQGIQGIQGEKGDPGDDYVLTEADKEEIASLATVKDVQVNNASLLDSEGVANIPIASSTDYGVVQTNTSYGTGMYNGKLFISKASNAQVKGGTEFYKPIVPETQHESAFYGLAKAAGDTTQSVSSNAVGTYTDEAKSAIKNMLGASEVQIETVNGTAPIHTVVLITSNG